MEHLTIIDGNLSIALRNTTDLLFYWGKELSEVLPTQRCLFNVPRKNFATYIFLVLVKNTFVSYGVSSIIPRYLTVALLMTLTCFRLAFQEESYVFDWTLIWAGWAMVWVLHFNPGFIALPAVGRYFLSVAALTGVTVFLPPYFSSEFIIDVFCIASLAFYIIRTMWQPFVIIFECFAFGIMVIFLLLTVDACFKYEGLMFDLVALFLGLFIVLCIAIIQRQRALVAALIAISFYCVCERVYFHRLK